MTMPGSTACPIPSTSMEFFRSTTNTPGSAQAIAMVTATSVAPSRKLMTAPAPGNVVLPCGSMCASRSATSWRSSIRRWRVRPRARVMRAASRGEQQREHEEGEEGQYDSAARSAMPPTAMER